MDVWHWCRTMQWSVIMDQKTGSTSEPKGSLQNGLKYWEMHLTLMNNIGPLCILAPCQKALSSGKHLLIHWLGM